VKDGHGLARSVVVIDDRHLEAEAAMEGDRAGVPDRRDRLQPQRTLAARRVGERRVQATPETGAAGIVPDRDQMHIPGAGRGHEPEDVPADPFPGPGDQACRTELLHQRGQMQGPEVAFAPVAGVIGEDLAQVGQCGRFDL
jgi:hypothetical protein